MTGDTGDTGGTGGAPDAAAACARTFVEATAWGEHHNVWEMLSTAGRRKVLEVAVARGMDEAQANRLGEGTAGRTEREMFLTDLVNGLRADLEGGTMDDVQYRRDAIDPGPGLAGVTIVAPMVAGLSEALPVAGLELTQEDGQWRVERVLPLGFWAQK